MLVTETQDAYSCISELLAREFTPETSAELKTLQKAFISTDYMLEKTLPY